MTNVLLVLNMEAVSVFFYLLFSGEMVVMGTKHTFYTLKNDKFNYFLLFGYDLLDVFECFLKGPNFFLSFNTYSNFIYILSDFFLFN